MFQKTSFTTLVVGVFVVYVLHTCWVMYGIVYTKPCDEPAAENCIGPYLAEKPRLELSVYTAQRPNAEGGHTLVVNEGDFDVHSRFERVINVSLPKKTRKNGTLYAMVFVHQAGVSPWQDPRQVHLVTQLTTYMLPKPPEVSLMSGHEKPEVGRHPMSTLMILLLQFKYINVQNTKYLQRTHLLIQRKMTYLPLLFVDELSNRVKDLMEINSSTTEIPLTVSYDTISLSRLRFWIHMQDAVFSLQQFGFTERDVDEIKAIFVDTNMYFLALTFFVAAFHLLFDFLAFKNDISFWKKKKSMVGMSSKAVLWRCFSTVVIFFYLMDEQTSLLVLIPAGVGAIIEVLTARVETSLPQFGKSDESERRTEEYDTLAMKYLSYLLYPLCVGGAVYSLFFVKYKSWYSWVINSLVNGESAFSCTNVRTFRFAMKSVAHLPWKAFMYKAFNTFIDDVFAFIITMPTSHRLACFRDDVVFIIYLYQRWLYPVDKTRVNEYGVSYDDKPKGKSHKE
uniref:Lipid scramblase CLPTM1L n=1 Tax=Denticeps clupeoides TaxID=299321 RepID=A0AAY4CV28_9TELE